MDELTELLSEFSEFCFFFIIKNQKDSLLGTQLGIKSKNGDDRSGKEGVASPPRV